MGQKAAELPIEQPTKFELILNLKTAKAIDVTLDPVGAGFVTSLARPGGNATGFSLFEFGISGKWLELLKQIFDRHYEGCRDPPAQFARRWRAVGRAASCCGAECPLMAHRDVLL